MQANPTDAGINEELDRQCLWPKIDRKFAISALIDVDTNTALGKSNASRRYPLKRRTKTHKDTDNFLVTAGA
jgi:hypothetical protein